MKRSVLFTCSRRGIGTGWSIHGWNEHLDTILKAALSNGEDAKKETVAMIDLLAVRRFRTYRNMLPT